VSSISNAWSVSVARPLFFYREKDGLLIIVGFDPQTRVEPLFSDETTFDGKNKLSPQSLKDFFDSIGWELPDKDFDLEMIIFRCRNQGWVTNVDMLKPTKRNSDSKNLQDEGQR